MTLIGKSSLEENHEINQRSRDIKKYFDIPHCTKPPCALPCVFSCPVQMICLRPALSNSTPGRKTSKRSGCVMLSSGLDFHTPGFNIASILKLSKYNAHLNLQSPRIAFKKKQQFRIVPLEANKLLKACKLFSALGQKSLSFCLFLVRFPTTLELPKVLC